MPEKGVDIAPADGKLGVLLVGLGAVSTTLVALDDIVFGAWDIFPDNAYDAAMNAGVLEKDLLNQVSEQLASLKPMRAVFEQNYVKRLHGENVKTGKNKMDLAEQLIEDI